MSERRFWLGVASREHVLRGKEGGFAQFCHGKYGPARRPQKGDGLVYYSGKEVMEASQPCQRFTALGIVLDDGPAQVEVGPEFHPWRRQVEWKPLAEAEIRPLIGRLAFILDKSHWGSPFRFGFLQISQADFEIIQEAMQ